MQQGQDTGHKGGFEHVAEQRPLYACQVPGLPVRAGLAQKALGEALGGDLGGQALEGVAVRSGQLNAEGRQRPLPGEEVHRRRVEHHAVHVKHNGSGRPCGGQDVGLKLAQVADTGARCLRLVVAPVNQHGVHASTPGALDVVTDVIAHIEQPLSGPVCLIRHQVKDAWIGLGQLDLCRDNDKIKEPREVEPLQ